MWYARRESVGGANELGVGWCCGICGCCSQGQCFNSRRRLGDGGLAVFEQQTSAPSMLSVLDFSATQLTSPPKRHRHRVLATQYPSLSGDVTFGKRRSTPADLHRRYVAALRVLVSTLDGQYSCTVQERVLVRHSPLRLVLLVLVV